MSPAASSTDRGRRITRILLLEGSANLTVLVAKATVGIWTGSSAILGDALHSLTDVANNVVALMAHRAADTPPDREHPYGHRKFETLAVFGLATLLAVVAIEIAIGALERDSPEIRQSGWGLAIMLGVLFVNAAVSTWESYWARRLDSELLLADAHHTFSDVLITLAVITGWQLAARGLAWLDTVLALGVAAMVLVLAYRLFARAIPVLVDRSAVDADSVVRAVEAISGVRRAHRVRSRGRGDFATLDVVVSVAPDLTTAESHAIADAIEAVVAERFEIHDVTVHVEPDA